MSKIKEEQRIIDQYHENMRQHELKLEMLSIQERELEKREQEIFEFKREIHAYIRGRMSMERYPLEVRQSGDANKHLRQSENLEAEINAEFRLAEERCQKERESLQTEKKKLFLKAETYFEEYRKKLKTLDKGEVS